MMIAILQFIITIKILQTTKQKKKKKTLYANRYIYTLLYTKI